MAFTYMLAQQPAGIRSDGPSASDTNWSDTTWAAAPASTTTIGLPPAYDRRPWQNRLGPLSLLPSTTAVEAVEADVTAPSVPSPATTLASVRQELEEQFGQLGDPVGPYISATGRAKGYAFWRGFGAAGADWLIRRLDRPVSVETACGVANVLAMLGPAAVDPIVNALQAHLPDETADTLLSALAGMDPKRVARWSSPIREVVRVYLQHADDAVRGKAVNATASLDSHTAVALLAAALPYEPDENLRAAINDEIVDRT